MLLDSNIIIYAARPEHEDLLALISENAPAVSVISLIEVLGYHGLTPQDRADFDAQSAAKKILRGVELNRAIIIFPSYARLFWWLARLSPGLLVPFARKTVNDFRRTRDGDG